MVEAGTVTGIIDSLGSDAVSALVGLAIGAGLGAARWSVAARMPGPQDLAVQVGARSRDRDCDLRDG